MAIYITGDTHGDFTRFSTKRLRKRGIELTKDDYVIICGDFGGVWYHQDHPSYKSDLYWQKWLANKPWTTLFVDGNHENFSVLNSYPVEEWCGGRVHHIVKDKVIHLMRGEIFTIEGKTFLAMGGATSHDKEHRIENISWWREEEPNYEEWSNAYENLYDHRFYVDYVITHCASHPQLYAFDDTPVEREFRILYNETDLYFKHWYFGHYHMDKSFSEHFTCLYHNIIKLNPEN
jgi:hypothetical protein